MAVRKNDVVCYECKIQLPICDNSTFQHPQMQDDRVREAANRFVLNEINPSDWVELSPDDFSVRCFEAGAAWQQEQFNKRLEQLRSDIIDNATDTVWVGASETACERITTIIGDSWGSEGDCSSPSEKISHLESQLAIAREALELVAVPKRNDGTYNRCREACELLAKDVIAKLNNGTQNA
jgi:hypothetical protein